ncbi:MAG: hypothetical protein GF387_01015 [Candidatus Portnoybacteria bacterium]|nr:hypothetical protein [Candidatus Portnoybacteria bacterium]
MQKDKFEKLVQQGIDAIPEKFLKKLNNVDIVIEQEPTREQLKKLKIRGLLFGLYEGIPQTKRRHYTWVMPDKITIFQKPIEQYCKTEEQIKEKVKETVWHEIAHHFGLDEDQVRKARKSLYL